MREIKAYGRGVSSLHGEDFLDKHIKPIMEGLVHLQQYLQGFLRGELDKSADHRIRIIISQLGDISRVLSYRQVKPDSPRGRGEGAENNLTTALGGLIIHSAILCDILAHDVWKVVHDELDRLDNSVWRDS